MIFAAFPGLSPFPSAVAGVVLVAVLLLVVFRPRGLDVAWFAGGGALVLLALGVLSLSDLGVIFGDTWDAALTLIALFILSEALASNGFFLWAALRLARFARGSGWRLYALVLLLTTATTALLANDGAVLMLTPIYVVLLKRIHAEPRLRLPYLFVGGFFADAMSGILVPSNLTNIILADATRLSFARVLGAMIVPTLCAFVVAGAAFGVRFRKALGVPFALEAIEDPTGVVRDRGVFVAGWLVIGGLIVGYVLAGQAHLPVALVAGTGALVMLALVWLRGLRSPAMVLRAAPWSILIYALGMFVVITAADVAHVLTFLTAPLRANVTPAAAPAGALFAGGLLALLSAAVNNLPASLVGVLALRAAHPIARVAIYAIMLGVDIGPKLTPFGSLATLLWFGILAREGIHISWGHYLRENWWVALLTLAAAFGGLLVAYTLLGV